MTEEAQTSTLTVAELYELLLDAGSWFGNEPAYVACDADKGYVHRISGVRPTARGLVIDIDYDCGPEKLEKAQ